MAFQPRMTSSIEGITLLDDLRWRRWNGVVADVWRVHCRPGARGEYVSRDARLFVVLERARGQTQLQLSASGGAVDACAPVHMSYVPAGMPLWSRVEVEGELRHLDLHFDIPALAERLGEDLDPDRLATPRLGFMDERIHALARLIAQECVEPDARHDLYGDGLVMSLFIDLMQLGRSPASRRTALSPRQLRRVTAFIEENCLRNVRLQELAALTDLSQSYFSHAFKAATGLPPGQWHMQARMRRVQHMLEDAQLPLTQIAVAAGFADQAHFTRVFRRFCGVTPAAWRRARRG
ncbi:helix-turn-helix domain-containing protein [Xanthobacter sp. AM11]|uniref:helix-turn-helix domain-containing protein n=1 Tax=Xanthobacter sp. AM11 TaxID=3380643 RepID=UPI0039BFC599